jgi:type I restriction enzyme S subunit
MAVILAGYKQTEVGLVPEDWEVTPFLSIGSVIDGDRGANYPGSRDFASDGHCLFLNAGNVTKAGFRFNECAFINREKDERLSKGKLKRGDIVLTTRGTVGNFAHFDSKVPFENIRINSGMVILRRDSAVLDIKFLYAQLQSHVVEQQVERLTFGSAQPQLTVKGISKFSVVLPPLPEQRAIAAALSDVDALLAKLDQLIAKKRDLKQATMQQLLTGQTRLPGFSGVWKMVVLGNLLTMKATYGIVTAGDFKSAGVPMMRGGDIKGGQVGRNLPFVSPEKSSEYSRTVLKQDDVVIALVGYPGEAAKVPLRLEGANISRAVGLLRLNKDITPDYLVSYLNSPIGRRMVLAPSAGSAQLVVNLADLNKLVFPLPSLSEQTAIATVLSNIDAELAALEARRNKISDLKQGMMQELLTGRVRLV